MGAVAPTYLVESALKGRLQELLSENGAALRELRSTAIFMPPPPPSEGRDEVDISADAPLEPSSTLQASDSLQHRIAADELRAENAKLRAELETAYERASTIAECQRKQSEIHATLLRAAHDEAVEARNEARADAASLRSQCTRLTGELEACRQRLSVQRQTADAEAALFAAETRAARQELTGADASRATSTAGLHVALLRAELAASERAPDAHTHAHSQAGAGLAALDSAAQPPRCGAALRELKQWCGTPASPSASPDGGKAVRVQTPLERLSRLEATVEVASRRFEALQAEHDALQRKHARLKQKVRARAGRGGRDDVADVDET